MLSTQFQIISDEEQKFKKLKTPHQIVVDLTEDASSSENEYVIKFTLNLLHHLVWPFSLIKTNTDLEHMTQNTDPKYQTDRATKTPSGFRSEERL